MWSTDDVRTFYGSYAARYDEEIEADPDSYPGPDKVAGWMLSHLELRGSLPRARIPAKRNEPARPETTADGRACGRGGVHTDRRRRKERTVAEEDEADGVCEDGLASEAAAARRFQTESSPDGGAAANGDIGEDPSTCPRAGLCSGSPETDRRVQVEDAGGASVIEILDLGCGTGRSSRLFFEHPFAAGRLRLTGVDATPEMLEKARLFPFHALHCLNIEQPLGIAPNSFDAVVCVGVMDFVALPKPFLEQVARILRPEGVFGVTLPERRRTEAVGGCAREDRGTPGSAENDELSSFECTEADDLVSSAGFRIHRRERFLGYVDSITGAETHYYGYLLRLG